MKKIHIVLLGLYEHDAIGNFTRSIASYLDASGACCAIYAEDHSPALSTAGKYDDFFACVQPCDTLLYMFSNDDGNLHKLMSVPCHRIVYYHNITPGSFFRPYDAGIADMLDNGRKKIPLISAADAVFANSAWSLSELQPHIAPTAYANVMPPLTEKMFSRFESPQQDPPAAGGLPVPYLLTIGRIVPHKNIAWGIRQFMELRKLIPELTYAIVGSDGGVGTYAQEMRQLADSMGGAGEAVRFVGEVPDGMAPLWIRHAAALLCASQHEGFGVPLVEAMLQGVPVMAMDQPAVVETLGGAGLILEEKDLPANAQKMAGIISDPEAVARMCSQQKQRCQAIKAASIHNPFWKMLLA